MGNVERLIPRDRSVVVAADVEAEMLSKLVQKTCLVEGIGGYKIGLELVLEQGLPRTVGAVKEHSNLPVIYDHQKAGNDIPDMGTKFAAVCRKAGVDAVILFPFASAKTERDWIKACQDQSLGVLVGGHMTQPEFLENEGGFISVGAPDRIYTIAAQQGVRDFVVPGNKVEFVAHYRWLLEGILGVGNFRFYAPGFITQKGEVSEFAKVAGTQWHAIVGSAIYKAVDIAAAAKQMTAQIR